MSQMAARGLAPRRTPGAVLVARQSSTAYWATAGDTATASVARWACQPRPRACRPARRSASAYFPPSWSASWASLAASG